MPNKRPLILLTLLWLRALLPAQEAMEIQTQIDWETTTLRLDMTAPIAAETDGPTGRYKTEQRILRQAPLVTGEILMPLRVDSWNTIGDLVAGEPVLLRRLESLSGVMRKIFTTATPDRKNLTVRYELDLFPHIANLLIKHERAYSLPQDPSYVPNGEFTGVVVYAGEPLPWHGTDRGDTLLEPCLFPRLFDQRLRELHSLELTDPQAVAAWGSAGYSYSPRINELASRVGVYPLRIMARGIYGKNRTDLILPEDAVKMLSTSPHNRELLRQGRVVIILPPRP